MIKLLIVLFLALIGYSYYDPSYNITSKNVVSINNDPVQKPVESKTLKKRGYTVTTRYSYALKARVIDVQRYTLGVESAVSPLDMVLGWKDMSKPDIYRTFRISQRDRRYFWKYDSDLPAIPLRDVKRQSANVSLIPFNKSVLKELERSTSGDIISIEGYLVDVKKGTYEWNTSTSRSDSGEGSSEIILVTSVKVTKADPK